MSNGEKASLTSIAYQTGVIMGRKQVAQMLETIADEWVKPTSFSYPSELRKLATILKEANEPTTLPGSPRVHNSTTTATNENKE